MGTKEHHAFQTLQDKLCEATTQPMSIADFSKPWIIQVDASSEIIGAACLQCVEGQGHKPIAFASQKLTPTQKAWPMIEKEEYAAIWALDKFRNWIFGQPVTLYSDHNPLSYYLTESTSKSSNLMRYNSRMLHSDRRVRKMLLVVYQDQIDMEINYYCQG